jgi:aerobic-type carbon monoxide dehydrogenase small subunit (CoxS/CutS family)
MREDQRKHAEQSTEYGRRDAQQSPVGFRFQYWPERTGNRLERVLLTNLCKHVIPYRIPKKLAEIGIKAAEGVLLEPLSQVPDRALLNCYVLLSQLLVEVAHHLLQPLLCKLGRQKRHRHPYEAGRKILLDGNVEAGDSAFFDLGTLDPEAVEGLRDEDGRALNPIQRAMVECQGTQCGFCTPGFVMQITAMLMDNPHPSEAEIRETLSGNICRCTGYGRIIDAVQRVAVARAGGDGK